MAAVHTALAEAPLAGVTPPRRRLPEARPLVSPPGRGWTSGVGGLVADVRFALRQFRRAPSFAAVAVLTLGLGAGAATAIFSIVDAVVLRPLPYRAPDQLVALLETNPGKALPKERLSPVNFMDYRALSATFADSAAWWRPEISLYRPGSEPQRVSAIETSANLFELLGVAPQIGPGFPAGGPFYSRDTMAVISDRLWRTRYHADPSIVGRLLDIPGSQYLVTGVMPPGFNYPDDVDVWLRLNWDLTHHSRGAHFMEAVARLQPGVTVERAAADLASLSGRLAAEAPATNEGWSARPVPLLDDMLGYYRPALFVLLGAVALLLVTACLNVASLLLARASGRARELAVRGALGASRPRLLRQLLVEALVLALAGTAAGAAGAVLLLRTALAVLPLDVPRLAHAAVDLRLLAAAVAVVAATAVLFGVLPAIVLSRAHAADLKDGTRTSTAVRGRRWNHALVVAEVALACAVLMASALLVRSVSRMLHAPTGASADSAVAAAVQLPASGYASWARVDQGYDTLLATLRRQPGVAAAGATAFLPLEAGWRMPFQVDGRAARPDDYLVAQHIPVTSGYFETVGATLVAGRLFVEDDRADTEPVVIVNATFARRVFGEAGALGQRLVSSARNIGPLGVNVKGAGPFRIVGVVADVQQAPLGQAAEPVIYHTLRQFPYRTMAIVARGADVASVTAAMRTALQSLDPTLPLGRPQTLAARLADRAAAPRLLMFVLTAFAVLTGVLAAVGVYGLLACIVNDRRRDLAIRLALGAHPRSLAAAVAWHGMGLTLVGVAAGLAVSQLARRPLNAVLFETAPLDVTAAAATVGLLLLAAAAACVAPAWRAARVPAIEGLRGE
jgi:predicted permease